MLLLIILSAFATVKPSNKNGDVITMEEKKMLLKEITNMLKDCDDMELIHLIYLLLLKADSKV